MSERLKFPKSSRLHQRKLIESVFETGISCTAFPLRGVYAFFPQDGNGALDGIRLAVMVSSRTWKRAVDRNRIKRLCREAWRLDQHTLKDILKEKIAANQQLALVCIYVHKELPALEQLRKSMLKLCRKIAGT